MDLAENHFYPDNLWKLHREFIGIREDELKAKSWWFKSRAVEFANSDYKCSRGWINI